MPAGSYDLSVKFTDYCQQDQELVLNDNSLKDGQWEKQTVLLKSENSSENLNLKVAVQDKPDASLKNAKITLQPEGSTEKVSIPLDNNGNSSKKVSVANNVCIHAEVDYGEGKHAQSFMISEDKQAIENKDDETPDDSPSDAEDIPIEDYKEYGSNEEENYVFIEDQNLYLTFYTPEFIEEEDTWRLECDEEEATRETEILQNNPRKLLAEQDAAILDRKSFETYIYADGMLSAENQQAYYPVDLEDNSYWIEFEQAYPYGYDTSSWHIMVLDDSNAIRLEFNVSVDSQKAISDIVDLEAGQYYIFIESYGGDGVFNIDYTWYLKNLHPTLTFNETEEFEDEQGYTDTFIYGCISQPDDIDYYSFQLETDAVIAFKFEHALLSDNETDWMVMLKNEFGNIIGKISVIGNEPDVISNNIGLTPGRYTIEVSSGEDYYCSGIYALSTKKYACNYWEKEPDNAFSHDEGTNLENAFSDTDEPLSEWESVQNELRYANELVNGVGIYANLSDCNDVDNFMFICPKSGSYDLLCNHDEIMTDSPGLYIKIYNSAGDLIEDYQFYSDWNNAGIMNTIELTAGEIYYISIESGDGWQNEDYLLRVVSNHEVPAYSTVLII